MSDAWTALRKTTRARIGLGRTGDALPIKDVLEFQLAHARARDAVHTSLDTLSIAQAIAPLPTVTVHSKALDQETYLRRPDLGRQLDPACHADLAGTWDAVFVIADGLSPMAVQLHAAPLLRACLASVARLVGRTDRHRHPRSGRASAMRSERTLQADLCAVLIGERPGLSVANSLGVYLTYHPRVGRRDSERNCISNVHADGLSHEAAADMLAWLMTEARSRKLTGVALKDDRVTIEKSSPGQLPAARRSE